MRDGCRSAARSIACCPIPRETSEAACTQYSNALQYNMQRHHVNRQITKVKEVMVKYQIGIRKIDECESARVSVSVSDPSSEVRVSTLLVIDHTVKKVK